MIAEFDITLHELFEPRTVRVKIHDNVAALRAASTRHHNRGRKPKEQKRNDFAETLGICHRFESMNSSLCAIVRLAPPNLGVGIVTHELAHAAVWIREMNNPGETPLTCENDEGFCWILGELVRCTTNKLFEKGIYS